jgi:hypothetical protein
MSSAKGHSDNDALRNLKSEYAALKEFRSALLLHSQIQKQQQKQKQHMTPRKENSNPQNKKKKKNSAKPTPISVVRLTPSATTPATSEVCKKQSPHRPSSATAVRHHSIHPMRAVAGQPPFPSSTVSSRHTPRKTRHEEEEEANVIRNVHLQFQSMSHSELSETMRKVRSSVEKNVSPMKHVRRSLFDHLSSAVPVQMQDAHVESVNACAEHRAKRNDIIQEVVPWMETADLQMVGLCDVLARVLLEDVLAECCVWMMVHGERLRS